MSLSSWIRDYIYIPLGGNRAHRTVNLIVAMALCGLWHGAAWNFVVWGLYHGFGLVLEAAFRARFPAWSYLPCAINPFEPSARSNEPEDLGRNRV